MLSMGFIKKVYLFANKYFFIVNMGSKLSSQAFILYDSNSMIFWEKKKKHGDSEKDLWLPDWGAGVR